MFTRNWASQSWETFVVKLSLGWYRGHQAVYMSAVFRRLVIFFGRKESGGGRGREAGGWLTEELPRDFGDEAVEDVLEDVFQRSLNQVSQPVLSTGWSHIYVQLSTYSNCIHYNVLAYHLRIKLCQQQFQRRLLSINGTSQQQHL
jgi:hypothetical protein